MNCLNVSKIKKDFPILERKINGKPLVYLDNAATTQKPRQVIDALVEYYKKHNANIHRGIHTLAEEATDLYEKARKKTARFLKAKSEKEIIFVRNSTEAINLVAYSFGRSSLKEGDEVLFSEIEHHSNIVPWQILAKQKNITPKVIKTTREGYLDIDSLEKLLGPKTKLICIAHVSNVLGIINPLEKITALAKRVNAKVLVDGSQSAPRMPIDVKALGCDFFVATGHKMLGPTGIGVLWADMGMLDAMPPFFGGGDMIKTVTLHGFTVNELPYKFEAGTPNIAGAIGLGAAIDYLDNIGMENIFSHEKMLTAYALERLGGIDKVEILGPKEAKEKIGVVAFNVCNIHPHDLAQLLDEEGIAIRSGHHCAMPLHREKYHVAASARASFYIYNGKEDIDRLVDAIERAKMVFR